MDFRLVSPFGNTPSSGTVSQTEALVQMLGLSLGSLGLAEGGVFTRITMTSMTSQWYLRLNHFEAILVGLVVLQIFVMSYLLILPLDLTQLIEKGTLLATSVSRKKRATWRNIDKNEILRQQRLAESMFAILRRLDEDDCFLRTLCELENDSERTFTVSNKLHTLLTALKRLGLQREKFEKTIPPSNETILERKVLADFEAAVLLGSGYSATSEDLCPQQEENICATQYSLCSEETSILFEHVKDMMPFL